MKVINKIIGLALLLVFVDLGWATGEPMVLIFNTALGYSDQHTVSLNLNGNVRVLIDWGDGSSSKDTIPGSISHTYAQDSTIDTVKITGSLSQFGRIYDSTTNADKLVAVTSFGDLGLQSLQEAFSESVNLIQVPEILPPSVTTLTGMFFNCYAFNQDISNWNTTNVTDMSKTFIGARSFNQNIANWNTANVTNMQAMFSGASAFNQPIGNWNTAQVTNMAEMFYDATAFNQSIENWNTSKVIVMSYMFGSATSFNQAIGNWNISNVTDMSFMFAAAKLSTLNYDSTLIGWARQQVQKSVSFDAGASEYSIIGKSAHDLLTNNSVWIISDSGITVQMQNIVFDPITNHPLKDSILVINGTTSSSLPLSFTSSTPNICTVSGDSVSLLGLGVCTILASQTGDSSFAAASPISQSFSVTGTTAIESFVANNSKTQISIFNSNGAQVWKGIANSGANWNELGMISPGVYYLYSAKNGLQTILKP